MHHIVLKILRDVYILVFFSGTNHVLYKVLVSRLADVVRERMKANKKSDYSGVIINTCGWVQGID